MNLAYTLKAKGRHMPRQRFRGPRSAKWDREESSSGVATTSNT